MQKELGLLDGRANLNTTTHTSPEGPDYMGRMPAAATACRTDATVTEAQQSGGAFPDLAGLQATWCAQGKQAAEFWGKLFNVDVTWFDGELSAPKQRAAIDNMASQQWDFVAIQAFGIGTLTDPVKKMIDAGIPVIDMDTLIAPLEEINQLLVAGQEDAPGSSAP